MTTETSLMGTSAFSVAPNDFRIVHPLSASPASTAFFPPTNCSPPPSQPQHHPTNGISSNPEDVTTIFVVGFPDDMLEREFQNMFTFSPGFEAASLKWHCKDQDDDNTLPTNTTTTTTSTSTTSSNADINNTNNNMSNGSTTNSSLNNGSSNGVGKKQMIGFARFRTRLEAMEAVEVLSGKRIDNEKGSVLKAEMAKKNLHIKRGSIVPNAHPSISGGSSAAAAAAAAVAAAAAAAAAVGVQPSQQPSSLSHHAQPQSQHPLHQAPPHHSQHPLHSHHAQPSQPSQQPHHHHQHQHHHHQHHHSTAVVAAETGSSPLSILSRKMSLHPPPTAYDTFSPLPSDLLSPADYKTDPFNDHPLANGSSIPTNTTASIPMNTTTSTHTTTSAMASSMHATSTGGFNDPFFNLRSQSFDARSNDLVVSPRAFSLYPRPTHRVSNAMHGLVQEHTTSATAVPGSMIAQHNNDSDPFGYLSKSSPVVNDNRLGNASSFFESAVTNGAVNTEILSSRMNSLLINNNNSSNNNSTNGMTTPTSLGPTTAASTNHNNNNNMPSPNHFRGSISSSSNNPADQNPPCNTLYVGNLPPFTSEDELRQLFSKCTNFKRLLFRSKNQQGPMCFVEFEDVVYATQAMTELQGHTLSNSVKGGIRLSFSKNPLFTKPNGTTGMATTTSSSNSSSISSSSNKKGGDSFMFDPPM